MKSPVEQVDRKGGIGGHCVRQLFHNGGGVAGSRIKSVQ